MGTLSDKHRSTVEREGESVKTYRPCGLGKRTSHMKCVKMCKSRTLFEHPVDKAEVLGV